ncbi:hypothetical protein ACS0TY_014416 [Phlomoides rotata]
MTNTTDTPASNTTLATTTTALPPPVVPLTAHHHLPIKLTYANYPSWRAYLVALLRGHDLLGFIDGTSVSPKLDPSGSNVTAVTAWIR